MLTLKKKMFTQILTMPLETILDYSLVYMRSHLKYYFKMGAPSMHYTNLSTYTILFRLISKHIYDHGALLLCASWLTEC